MLYPFKIKAVSTVCLLGLALSGCQRTPPLTDTLGSAVDYLHSRGKATALKIAPIVIVGVVEENRIVRRHVEAARYPDVYLDLHKVRCRRENTLKGGLTGPEVEFYYFADGRYPSTPNPTYKRLFNATPRSRYLFFLKWERGVLRSIGDVGEYSFLIATGAHEEVPTEYADIGRRLAEILLTPGVGADLDRLSEPMLLTETTDIADSWGSRPYTVELLRRLLSHGYPIRTAVCGRLVTGYYGQDDCLEAIASDANAPLEDRQAASQELKRGADHRQRLLDDLKDPARLENLNWPSRRGLLEELQTLLFNRDPLLRARVCAALKRYYPYDSDPHCPDLPPPPAR